MLRFIISRVYGPTKNEKRKSQKLFFFITHEMYFKKFIQENLFLKILSRKYYIYFKILF